MNFLLDTDGDLAIVSNSLQMVSGPDEIVQLIKANLESVRGEWFLDTSLGLPWFEEILEKRNSANSIDMIFVDAITKSDGVVSLLSFTSNLDRTTRTLSIEFSVLTVEGIIDFSQTIGPGGL